MSDAFEKWHDTYESDTRELLMYNVMDLKAAWDAANMKSITLRAMFDAGYARGYRDRVIEEDSNADAKGQDLYGRGD